MSLYRPLEGDSTLPPQADVVVIGGGIIGASTALELAERGHRVALCEKGDIGAEQSCRNWGWVRRQGRDPAELPLAIAARALWAGLAARVGFDAGYTESGILYAAANAREMANHEAWFAKARGFGLDSKLLSAAELAALFPGTGRRFTGGLFTAQDGRAEPRDATYAIAQGARKQGAALLTSCAVRGIDTTAGRLSGVVTERGLIKCGAALIAAGAWSRLFTGNLGINFKQLPVRGTVARIEHSGPAPEFAVGGTDFAVRKRRDGGYSIAVRNANIVELGLDNLLLAPDFLPALRTGWRELRLRPGLPFLRSLVQQRRWRAGDITPFERTRINSTAPYRHLPETALKNLIAAVPAFAGARLTSAWSGIIDTTPNALPVISPLPLPGLFLASGFSGHGFGIGLAAGRLAADLVTNATPFLDPTPFRFTS
ncbi:FAD-binding oxidoreductase [Acidocella sp.]|uniref:NAD(P)/FAD-dependent oxidoreductase n=1 Tax=Acidocella sp. TaxID=50710 RepID=UPI0026032C28|nr:FAD-binding oxidoreductase [Acidocella sp.]